MREGRKVMFMFWIALGFAVGLWGPRILLFALRMAREDVRGRRRVSVDELLDLETTTPGELPPSLWPAKWTRQRDTGEIETVAPVVHLVQLAIEADDEQDEAAPVQETETESRRTPRHRSE